MAGYKAFGVETLTAEDVNEYLMRQSIPRVANLPELGDITSPEPGMMAYRDDTATTYRHDGTNWRAWLYDTGWVDIKGTVSGFTGTVSARVLNGECTVSFDLVASGAYAGGTLTTIGVSATNRSHLAPEGSIWFSIEPSGSATRGRVFSGGSITLYDVPALASGASVRGSVSYPVG